MTDLYAGGWPEGHYPEGWDDSPAAPDPWAGWRILGWTEDPPAPPVAFTREAPVVLSTTGTTWPRTFSAPLSPEGREILERILAEGLSTTS